MVDIYIEGSCSGNPGPGKWTAIVVDDQVRVLSGDEPDRTTNNRMEITAAIQGLLATPSGSQVTIYSDSEYLIKSMTGEFIRRKNVDLFGVLDASIADREVEWRKGHYPDAIPFAPAATHSLIKQGTPANVVAKYTVANDILRSNIRETLDQRFSTEGFTPAQTDWGMRVTQRADKVTVSQFSNGTLLVQGRASALWDEVCTAIEETLTPAINEIASRFVSASEEEADRYAKLVSPALVSEADQVGQDALVGAWGFLAKQDQKYLTAALCLLNSGIALPEYSCVVMPASKAFEGYIKKLLLRLRLITKRNLSDNSFTIGTALDSTSWIPTRNFVKRQKDNKAIISMLKVELAISRHFLMHSDDSSLSKIDNPSQARKAIERICENIRKSYGALVVEK